MSNYVHNRFDSNFLSRMALSSALLSVVVLVMMPFIMVLLTIFFGPFGAIMLGLSLMTGAIGLVAEHFKLFPFPLQELFNDALDEASKEEKWNILAKSGAAITGAFGAAGFYIFLLLDVLALRGFGAVLVFLMVIPATLALTIVHLDAKTLSQVFRKGFVSIAIMLTVGAMMVPHLERGHVDPDAIESATVNEFAFP